MFNLRKTLFVRESKCNYKYELIYSPLNKAAILTVNQFLSDKSTCLDLTDCDWSIQYKHVQ